MAVSEVIVIAMAVSEVIVIVLGIEVVVIAETDETDEMDADDEKVEVEEHRQGGLHRGNSHPEGDQLPRKCWGQFYLQ